MKNKVTNLLCLQLCFAIYSNAQITQTPKLKIKNPIIKENIELKILYGRVWGDLYSIIKNNKIYNIKLLQNNYKLIAYEYIGKSADGKILLGNKLDESPRLYGSNGLSTYYFKQIPTNKKFVLIFCFAGERTIENLVNAVAINQNIQLTGAMITTIENPSSCNTTDTNIVMSIPSIPDKNSLKMDIIVTKL